MATFHISEAADDFRPRLLSESIAMAKKHAEELGYEPRMDPEFAADLEEIIAKRAGADRFFSNSAKK
jgi:hypothetical protein